VADALLKTTTSLCAENLWSSEQVCVAKLVGREAVMDKLVYTATNPVQDHLVERVHHWPGVNGNRLPRSLWVPKLRLRHSTNARSAAGVFKV
jgi:hypothetical protein